MRLPDIAAMGNRLGALLPPVLRPFGIVLIARFAYDAGYVDLATLKWLSSLLSLVWRKVEYYMCE
jgi:hypothetical protein